MSTLPNYSDDQYQALDNEFDQVRQCLGMYIGSGEIEGAMHLLNEIVTNSIDECTNSGSPADLIEFYFFEAEQKFIVSDNGRGIPLDLIHKVVGQKHVSTKFGRKANRYSGGQNGVGLTVTAALSSVFSVTSNRGAEHVSKTVYMDGNQLVEGPITKEKSEKHGCTTTFVPSKKYIGDFTITCEDVEDYLRRLSYIMPHKAKIKYMGTTKKGKSTTITYKRLGIAENVNYLSQDLEFPPITVAVPEVEIPFENKDSEFFKMELAFSYDRTVDQPIISSFCNFISTKEGGYHETVAIRGISDFFTRQAKAADPNHKYEITSEDCKNGLILVVNCDHTNPKFEGQHKSKVDQKNILEYGKKPIMDALTTYFETNNGLLRRIIQYLRQIARVRLESHKLKATALKKPTTFLDDAEMKIFANISDRNYSGYKELILAEGDSAISAVGAARNVQCQAIFAITGVVANTYGMSTEKVMATVPTFQALVKVLGCGIGKDFDITKLRWNAIIIATDKDVDGSNISSLLSVFFAYHMPGIVLAGRLYKVIPPLYKIDVSSIKKFYNGRDYLFDKSELYSLYHRIIAENLDMALVEPKNDREVISGKGMVTELSKKEKIKLLDDSIEYLPELETLVKRSACQMEILEYICYFLILTNDIEKFEKLITGKFPEIHYDSYYESLFGSFHGENVSLIVDKIFLKMSKRMLRIMAQEPTFYILYRNKNASKTDPQTPEWQLATIGQFLTFCDSKFAINILQRYKGLGESDTLMIFLSMMNPKLRKLLRINMDDVKSSMDDLKLLHGDGADLRLARRELLKEADITLADIDN